MSINDQVNILLVDDQPAKLLSYEVILRELGENLIKAGSAREALEHILKKDIAVILIDVIMPDLDGFELAAMIRGHPRFQTTAIIFVSAVAMTDLPAQPVQRAHAPIHRPADQKPGQRQEKQQRSDREPDGSP